MSANLPAYSIERLAPGSYDVFLHGSLVAALVRDVDSSGATREWLLDLLDDTSTSEHPAPFTAPRHTFCTLSAALEWLGIRQDGMAPAMGG